VTSPHSVHTARWIRLLDETDWDLHLFPSMQRPLHSKLEMVTAHGTRGQGPVRRTQQFLRGAARLAAAEFGRGDRTLDRVFGPPNAVELARVIERLRPDVVHSMEEQSWRLTLEARRFVRSRFPTWIAGDWGSDLSLFGRLQSHRDTMREVLRLCDVYACECARDQTLARGLGFAGEMFPVTPTCGGFDLDAAETLRSAEPPSARKLIMVKGYQGATLTGRAFFALKALERSAELLKGYRTIVFSARDDVEIACELIRDSAGIEIEPFRHIPEDEMLGLFARSRLSITTNISDGISTTSLEALVTGSFPIQSFTSCAHEWITDGENGFLVDPEDVDGISRAVECALTDDELVDAAAHLNAEITARRLDRDKIRTTVVDAYERVAAGVPVNDRQ